MTDKAVIKCFGREWTLIESDDEDDDWTMVCVEAESREILEKPGVYKIDTKRLLVPEN